MFPSGNTLLLFDVWFIRLAPDYLLVRESVLPWVLPSVPALVQPLVSVKALPLASAWRKALGLASVSEVRNAAYTVW